MAENFQPAMISTLLLGEPGLMRDSICTLLNAIPFIRMQRVMDLFQADWELPVDLTFNCIVVDCSNSIPVGRMVNWIAQVKKEHPQIRWLVISASAKQHGVLCAAGADMALIRGFSLSELQQSLRELFVIKN